ncbi:hypothetical protein [Polaromonas sp. LjRoot131]|jgi:hypothetical protein|uniref:hypothetical protein n=1 Tax=Polaromonas sp. LjRoot131 TaxID=3342262 RepID=UPI003ED11989
MTGLARSQLIAVAVAISACATAQATSSVSFEAEGYLLDIVVGGDKQPSIAGLSIAMPGSARSVMIPVRHLKVEAFDTTQKVLLLRFINPGDSQLPGDFFLSVRNDAGILQIQGKSLAGRFSWGM